MTVGSHIYTFISTIFGMISAVALVVVLVLKEAFRFRGAPKGDPRIRLLTIASLPLMAVFIALLAIRVWLFLE
jgi:hypothetical protein